MNQRSHVLIVEDDPDIAELVSFNLSRHNLKVTVESDGGCALQSLRSSPPDLVVLDIMLPGMDGLELCRALRSLPLNAYIPVILLTAKCEEADVVIGLDTGADDYVTKPFSPLELTARVKAILRRKSLDFPRPLRRMEVGPVIIDEHRHEVLVDQVIVPFTLSEFRILATLLAYPNKVCSRESLLSCLGGGEASIVDRNVDVHVRAIRKKLGSRAHFLKTVRGLGYKFQVQDDKNATNLAGFGNFQKEGSPVEATL